MVDNRIGDLILAQYNNNNDKMEQSNYKKPLLETNFP